MERSYVIIIASMLRSTTQFIVPMCTSKEKSPAID